MIRSLRYRLLVLTSLAAVLVLGLLGLALYYGIQRSATKEFDQSLLTEARAVAATAEQHGQNIIFDYAPDELPKFSAQQRPDYFQAWIDPDIVIRSPSLGGADLPRPSTSDGMSFRDVVLPDGRLGRTVSLSFTTTLEPHAEDNSSATFTPRTVILAVETDTRSLRHNLEDVRWILLGFCSLAVVILGTVLNWVVAAGIRPVERLASAIDGMRENDLSVRLHAPDAPTELEPVVEKLNGLLSRLESAFSREKAFTADVAHELRTPLAALLTTFEVCRSRPRDESAYIAAIDKCSAVSRQMQTMVETLLILTRADAGQLSLSVKPTDAGDLLSECWTLFHPRAESRGLKTQWQLSAPLSLQTDPEKLRIILHNLFDNAVSYAQIGGDLRVAAKLKDDWLEIEIANSGSEISASEIPHIFDRFWRGDRARTNTGLHCGLGLSLCQRLARLLNGKIEVNAAPGNWFVVRLSLPASPTKTPEALARPQADTKPISDSKPSPAAPLEPASAETLSST